MCVRVSIVCVRVEHTFICECEFMSARVSRTPSQAEGRIQMAFDKCAKVASGETADLTVHGESMISDAAPGTSGETCSVASCACPE